MRGLMQESQLSVTQILDYAAKWHGEQEVCTRTVEGSVVLSTYAEVHKRARLCALALQGLGIGPGAFVATCAWNTVRHMEVWYGIMGIGAVCHTLNVRLSDKDLKFIVGDAQDVLILADTTFAPMLARILPHCPSVQGVIFLTDKINMPAAAADLAVPVYCYEELLAAAVPKLPGFKWTIVPEDNACGMCYTSGTTGNPKGVLYSHRSNFLHAMVLVQQDSLPLGSASVCLAVVPMFHANSWGLVFAAPMVGAKLVLPGPWLDGESVYELIESQQVTVSAGVPTVWLQLINYMEEKGLRFSTMKYIGIGGAAPAPAMIEALEIKLGVDVRHLWGMTELSPLGTLGGPKGIVAKRARPQDIVASKVRQGRPHVMCDMRIVDDDGKELPHDGKEMGHLQVRGPATVRQYFKAPGPAVDADNWFATGDVCTIDKLGHMHITDRSKDVIKSGGEWISSIEIEGLAQGYPGVLEAAVVAIHHERWGERPLLCVVLRHGVEGNDELRDKLLKFLEAKLAKFAVPDDVVFLPEIPHNATGKVSKLTLRDMFKNHKPARPRL